MAKPNYSFQKRQKELLKKAKKEEKKQRKQSVKHPETEENVIIDSEDNSSHDEIIVT